MSAVLQLGYSEIQCVICEIVFRTQFIRHSRSFDATEYLLHSYE